MFCFPKNMLEISWEVPSLHANRKKCLKPLAWISYKDCDKLPIVHHECDTLSTAQWAVCSVSRHIRPWNLKKTKSSKRSKLKEIFIHIDCFAVQTIVENPLPAFSTTINLLRHKNDQADMKKHDYLSFSFSTLESRHSVVYTHVSSTKESCSSSQVPLKTHLCCEQNFGLLPSAFDFAKSDGYF